MLRKLIAVLILVPLAIILIAFAVANRQPVMLSLDPFSPSAPAAALTLPLFVIVLAALITGVIVGGLAVRLGHGRWRRVARRLERESGRTARETRCAGGQGGRTKHRAAPTGRAAEA